MADEDDATPGCHVGGELFATGYRRGLLDTTAEWSRGSSTAGVVETRAALGT
jgi:hypothetical protein